MVWFSDWVLLGLKWDVSKIPLNWKHSDFNRRLEVFPHPSRLLLHHIWREIRWVKVIKCPPNLTILVEETNSSLLRSRFFLDVTQRGELVIGWHFMSFTTETGSQGVRLAQKGNTGSRLFIEIKPCRAGLILGWVTTWAISRAVLHEERCWRSGHQSHLPPLLQMLPVGRLSVDLNAT